MVEATHGFDIFEEKSQLSDADSDINSNVPELESDLDVPYCGVGCIPTGLEHMRICICTYHALYNSPDLEILLNEIPLLRNIFEIQPNNVIYTEFQIDQQVKSHVVLMSRLMLAMVKSVRVTHRAYAQPWNDVGIVKHNINTIISIAIFNYLIANPLLLRTKEGFRDVFIEKINEYIDEDNESIPYVCAIMCIENPFMMWRDLVSTL
jgi:hypothetical protein